MIEKKVYFLLGVIFILIIILSLLVRMYGKINSVDCVLLVGAAATICLLIGFIFEGIENANKDQIKINHKISKKIKEHIIRIDSFLSKLPKYTKFYSDFDEFTLDLFFNDFEYSQIKKEYSDFQENTFYFNENIKKLREDYTKIKNKINKCYHPEFMSTEDFCCLLTGDVEKIDKKKEEKAQSWIKNLEKPDLKEEIENIKDEIKMYETKEKEFLDFAKKHLEKLKKISERWNKEYERYRYLWSN